MADSSLGDFITQVTGDSHLRVEADLGDGFVRLRSAEAERRQAKHDIRGTEDVLIELLRNARDAHARNLFVAASKEGARRILVVLDDGDGIPERMREKVFEARVTSKLDTVHMDTWGIHGRGMALYAIRVNVLDAHVAATQVGGGSSFYVESDTNRLPEKADQSSKPVFLRTERGTVTVRGPRNINRTAAEFAYVERGSCTVYFGSPVDVAATLWAFGRSLLSASQRAFCNDVESVAVCKRIALASTPQDFSETARSLGIELSERSARRVMDGQIAPLEPLADQITVIDEGSPTPKPRARAVAKAGSEQRPATEAERPAQRIERVMRGGRPADVKLSDDDLRALARALLDAWSPIAQSYYLDPQVKPELTTRKGELRITLPLRPSGL